MQSSYANYRAALQCYVYSGGELHGYQDLLGNGLLFKKTVEDGNLASSFPRQGEFVRVSVEGFHLTNLRYMESLQNKLIKIGDGSIIRGLEIGLQHMLENESSAFCVFPELAYGDIGRDGSIPPNCTILYMVTRQPVGIFSEEEYARTKLCGIQDAVRIDVPNEPITLFSPSMPILKKCPRDYDCKRAWGIGNSYSLNNEIRFEIVELEGFDVFEENIDVTCSSNSHRRFCVVFFCATIITAWVILRKEQNVKFLTEWLSSLLTNVRSIL